MSSVKSPSKHQTPVLVNMSSFLSKKSEPIQESLMVQRAVSSAKKHGLDMKQGTPNAADGDCAFQSAIFNVNDRDCFAQKLPMSVDCYRKIWMIDMKNRTVNDKTWNIYTKQDWESGWMELLEPKTYERGLFGDLMVFGIACGMKKIILIMIRSMFVIQGSLGWILT